MKSITEQLTSRVVNEILTEAKYEATGRPEGRELSKKVNKHFEGIRGFIGAISGGKANEFQDHVRDGVFSGHDNHQIINNHGPLKNHGMQTDGDDYTADIHNYIDAVRAHHEYKTDVRDDSEKFYMGEAREFSPMGRPESDVPAEYARPTGDWFRQPKPIWHDPEYGDMWDHPDGTIRDYPPIWKPTHER